MKNEDEWLDEITEYLRNEVVPPLPKFSGQERHEHKRKKSGLVVFVGTLAMSVLGFLLWTGEFSQKMLPSKALRTLNPNSIDKTNVAVREILDARYSDRLNTELDELEAEVRKLRHQANLLEARHKADALLTQY